MQSALSMGVRASGLAASSFATSALCFPARSCRPDLCLAADDLCFAPTDAFLDMAEARCFAANDGVADRHSAPVNASRQIADINPSLRGIMILSPLITPQPSILTRLRLRPTSHV